MRWQAHAHGSHPGDRQSKEAPLQTDAGDSIVPALLGCVLKESGGSSSR